MDIIILSKKSIKEQAKDKEVNAHKGFTLIELICVMSIMAILTVVALPKMSGYVQEAKKTRALSKAREIVMAAETYNYTCSEPINDAEEYKDFKSKLTTAKYLDSDIKDVVKGEITYGQLKNVVEGKNECTLENEVLIPSTSTP